VTDPADRRAATTRAKQRRARRFVLPDVQDERTAARIVAFLDGPAGERERRAAGRSPSDRPRLPRELDTRQDWTAAFHHEAARHARYGRPASVLLLELVRRPNGRAVDTVAVALADLIRHEARETDRAVRMGPSSFRMLLPETSGRAARHVGARLERDFDSAFADVPDRPGLRVEVAAPHRGGSLEDALAEAERRVQR
jgi:GGDEF domain-containing protein